MTKFVAYGVWPDGHEGEPLEFEWDPATHESYHAGFPSRAVYLTADAPGVAEYAYQYVARGYLELVGPLVDGDPLIICDEDGIAKGLTPNINHIVTAEYHRKFSDVVLGPVVVVEPYVGECRSCGEPVRQSHYAFGKHVRPSTGRLQTCGEVEPYPSEV